jgi:hypothetical protein
MRVLCRVFSFLNTCRTRQTDMRLGDKVRAPTKDL